MRPFIWPFKYGIGSYFPLFPVLISFLVIISYFERRKHRYMYSVLPSLNAIFIQDWFPSAYNKIHSNNSAVLANYIEHSISRSHKKKPFEMYPLFIIKVHVSLVFLQFSRGLFLWIPQIIFSAFSFMLS